MIEFLSAFLGVFAAVLVLTPLSHKLGLIDHPDRDRKLHRGPIPLVGGIAIFSSVALGAFAFVPPSQEMAFLLTACALLTMTGTIDDRYNLNAYLRLLIQAATGALLVWGSNSTVSSLGNILGTGEITLGWLAVPFTIIATVGLINAYNMIDGIDGLAGGVCLISCLALSLLLWGEIADGASNVLMLLIGALSAYLIFNLHWIPRLSPKIFMGDAGSMVLGFIITAFVIRYTSGSKQVFEPTTALWVVALPLMDITATTFRRIQHGRNPLKPDRTHIHHIMQHAGLSPRKTLGTLLLLQATLCSIGLTLEWMKAPNWASAGLFILCFLIYFELVNNAFKASRWIRRHLE